MCVTFNIVLQDVYDSMATLYAAKETAKLVEDYSTYIEDLMRDHMAMTGFLGSACLSFVAFFPRRL